MMKIMVLKDIFAYKLCKGDLYKSLSFMNRVKNNITNAFSNIIFFGGEEEIN